MNRCLNRPCSIVTNGAFPPDAIAAPQPFTSGLFTVGASGQVSIDYRFDGADYQGELAIFSIEGLDLFTGNQPDLIQEMAFLTTRSLR